MKCKLCQINESSNIQSHYVSKFLRKDIFDKGQSIQIKKGLIIQKINDLPKDPNIFCKKCEHKFELIETLASRILRNLDEKNNYQDLYFEYSDFGNHIIELKRNVEEFNLFIISLIWRVSISNHYTFQSFKLPSILENDLRIMLFENTKDTHDEYKVKNNTNLSFQYLIIKPEDRNEYTRGHLSTFSPNSNIHMLF